jgi:Amidase
MNSPTLDRRDLVKLFAAILALPAVAQTSAETAPKITGEMLQEALKVAGLTFPPDQVLLMLPGVNRNLAAFESLRKLEIPLDTPPAFTFSPLLPGKQLPAGPSRFHQSKPISPAAWSTPEDLAFRSATELGHLVRTKKITPTELTKMYLARLKQYGPKLNCVITLTEDLALAQAERATAEIKQGKNRGALHGVPYGAKDLFDTKDILTTWGAEPYRDRVPKADATVIEKLDEAGAILLAKLSMGALAQGGLWFGGMTKTPWNYEQTSSGSSAGSASATAAGLVGFSIGTETLGPLFRRVLAAASQDCAPHSDASAGTVQWRLAGPWIRSAQSAAQWKIARWCCTPSPALTARISA